MREIGLAELVPDARNANKDTGRGAKMIEESTSNYGAGRSIVIDKNGVVIGGNKTLKGALAAGLKGIIVVPEPQLEGHRVCGSRTSI